MEVWLGFAFVAIPVFALVVGAVVTVVVQAKVSLVVAIIDQAILDELAAAGHRSYSAAAPIAPIERRYASR